MKKTKTYDMTEGNPTKLLLSFTIPMLIGNLFQQLYNMVDSIVVGQYVGSNALAAVGATGSIAFLIFSLSMGMSVGGGVIVSQYFGAKDDKHVMKTITNSLYVLTITSLLMSLIGFVFARSILLLLDTPTIIMDDAVTYLRVTCGGIIAIAAYNGIASILRALGDSKTPLFFLVVASVFNVVLDLVFVIIFKWSVFGVGLATILAQAIAAIGCFIYAYRKLDYFKIPKEYYKINLELIKKCVRIGIPVALQNSLISISCIVLQRVVNGFGENVVAAYTATNRFEQLVHQPFTSLNTAVMTYAGQNIGAGKIDRVKKGFWSATVMCGIFSLLMLPIGYFGAEGIMRLFVKEPEVIKIGIDAIRITSFFYFPLGLIYVSRGILNGAGDNMYAMLNGLVEVGIRGAFARPLTMIPAIGMLGVWYTTCLTWVISAIFSCERYARGKWKTKGVIKNNI